MSGALAILPRTTARRPLPTASHHIVVLAEGEELRYERMQSTLAARNFELIKEVVRGLYVYGVDAWRVYGDELDEAAARNAFYELDRDRTEALNLKEFMEAASVLNMCAALEDYVKLAEEFDVDVSKGGCCY
eukprot:SAG11_NODE_5435_length_1561_cov_0.913133_1_plen_132_part_00